jgi:predicted DNA-binding transcriptional regulator AlpA
MAEVLEIVGVTRSTFDTWRHKSMAPRTYKLPNGKLRFKLSDVEEWLEGLAVDDPETIRLKEMRELSSQGKRIPLRLYGPPIRGHR